MKKEKVDPPEEELIRMALKGVAAAKWEIIKHYDRLIRFMLNKEIKKAVAKTGLEEELFSFEDLLCDVRFELLNAIGKFRI